MMMLMTMMLLVLPVMGRFVRRYEPGALVIEFGHPRTATTLQHEIASFMAGLKNNEVGLEKPKRQFVDRVTEDHLKANRVLKTHDRLEAFPLELLETAELPVLLLTTKETDFPEVAYVQHKDDVERLSVAAVIPIYADIFNLTRTQTDVALAYVPFLYRTNFI